MRGIIDNIITSYEMQAKALGILVANTQKALKESDGKRKVDEQAERIENFVKGLTVDLNNMVMKFYWLKERKERQQEEMTPNQVKALADFANFVKALTKSACSVLEYFQKSPTFEEKGDKDIKELEAYIKAKLRKFEEALDETTNSSTAHLTKYTGNLFGNVSKFFKGQSSRITKRTNAEKPLKEPTYSIKKDSSTQTVSSSEDQLENLLGSLNINPTREGRKSKSQIFLKV